MVKLKMHKWNAMDKSCENTSIGVFWQNRANFKVIIKSCSKTYSMCCMVTRQAVPVEGRKPSVEQTVKKLLTCK